MKRILSILFLLALALPSYADRITASIQVIGLPADGDTLTVNGAVRTFKTTVATPATQIARTNNVNNTATNLYQQIIAYPYAGPLGPSYGAADTVNLLANNGNALVVTASGSWATITMTTQAVTGLIAVRVPVSGEPTASVRTNIASSLVQAESDYSTNTFAAGAVALTNHVNRTAAQTISGAKTFTGANVYSNASQSFVGGTSTGQTFTGVVSISGEVGDLADGTWTNPRFTNGVNAGDAFSSQGVGSGSEQFGASASAVGTHDLAVGNQADAEGGFGIAIGDSSFSGLGGSAVGRAATAGNAGSSAFGVTTTANFDNSTALGASATTTAAHQIMLGTSSEFVQFPGGVLFTGVETNFIGAGTNIITGQLAFPRANVTTLVNGSPNLVSTSTNLFLKLSGPTGAFTVNAMDGGSDGRVVILYNVTGQTMTIANNSGALGVAANRILTGTGADVVGVYAATLIYDSAQSLWILVSKN